MKLDLTLFRAVLAAGALLSAGASLVSAQDTLDSEDVGIVRISDCAPGQGPGCNTGACQHGCPSGQCGQCGNGMCGNGRCGYGNCGNGCGRGYCFQKCHCTGHVCRFLSWLDPCGGCTLPPDAGWAPPGKVAMWRKPVTYNKFFPDCWTGQPGIPAGAGMRASQVYMPTDTTQLGFYYQTVPQWQPVRGMVPGAPNPNDWHQPLCQPNCGNVVGASAESVNCPNGCPAAAPEAAPAAQPEKAPEPAAAAASELAAPAAPVADLSATGEAPALQPIPR